MKYLRFQLLAALLCLVAMVQAQETNVLRVEPVESPAGKALLLPIVMENTSDIAGVQFDIIVPYELATDTEGKVIANLSKTRANGHTVTVRKFGSGYQYYSAISAYGYKYRVIIYSSENQLFLDNTGTLITFQLTTGELDDGTELTVNLSEVTLSDREMKNKMTSTQNGKITIKEIPRPDLQPTDITFTQTEVSPGGKLNVSWKVKNIGKAATEEESGWSEEIALVNNTGSVSKVLATTHYSGQIAAESEVSRNVEIELPQLLGIDGITQVQINVIPDANAGEHQTLRDNNTAKSANNLSVAKHLSLEISPETVRENYGQRITIKLTRSGSWSLAESFKVTATNSKGQPCTETRISLPEVINILANQSAAILYLNITNNDVLDADRIINLKVEPVNTASTYAPVTGRIVIEDDELPTLTLKASKTDLIEGTDKNFKLTVETNRAPEEDLTVTIASENTRRFTTFPSAITIKAGETTAQMDVTVVNDELANGTLTNKFTASAPSHNKGEVLVMLTDDDLPVLELTITPTQVQESDGPISVSGTLKRLSNQDKKVTVKLSSDPNDGIYFGNSTLELAKGVEEVNFNFGPIDNQDVDGDRIYTITAAVWLSSCSCDAKGESAGHVSAQLTVLDDDSKGFRLTSANGTVKEGGTTTLTVTRNTNDTSEPVTATISSDYDAELTYEHTVTIPAGQKSVNVEVTSKKNSVANDSHTVIFTVESEGYSKGTCWVMVTDQTLPDATLPTITASPTTVKVGEKVQLTVEVSNAQGNAPLPATTLVKVYARGEKDALATFSIADALAIGDSREMVKSIELPQSVGKKQLYAVINEDKAVAELSNANNTSATIEVTVESPFLATLSTDKKTYNQNDMITFTGQLSGSNFEDAEADLYIVCEGTRQVERVRADATGKFEYKWQLTNALSGHAIAGVCYPDAGTSEKITEFDIYGLRRYLTSYIKHQLTVGEPVDATIQLVNPGILKLTGVKVEVVEKPEGYNFAQLTIPTEIAGGVDNALLTYKMTAQKPSTGNEWEQVKLLVTSNEGIELPITMYCYARMAEANLVMPNNRITTTMITGETRDYPIQLINNGKGTTGKLTLSLPDWMSCAQGTTLAGINPGDTATIVLRLKPADGMQLNVPVTGTIGFNVEYGNGTQASYSVTPISEKTGTLVVEVADEYTYYTDEKPHVKDAEVVLRNSVTNAIVMIGDKEAKGKTGEDGLLTFENLPEGYYKLSVTADNHDSYSNNIVVDPGITTKKVINLSVQSIKVSWEVEETEVEDVYDIVTTVTYETNVPAPVVETICPNRIPADELAEGESLVFYAIMTNKGLINAEDAELVLPERTGIYLWQPLAETTGLTIAPQQSYIIPVQVTRLSPSDSRMRRTSSDDSGCSTAVGTVYKWKCGSDWKWHRYSRSVTYKVCPGGGGGIGGWYGGGGGGGGLGWPGGGGGGGYGSSTSYNSVSVSNKHCVPCLDFWLEEIVSCVENFIPVYGCAKGLKSIADGEADAIDGALTAVGCSAEVCAKFGAGVAVTGVGAPAGLTLAGACTIVGYVSAGLSCVKSFITHSCDPDAPPSGYHSRKNEPASSYATPSYIVDAQTAGVAAEKEFQAMYDYMVEVFGDKAWVTDLTNDQIETVLAMANSEEGVLDAEKLIKYKPDVMTNEQFAKFIERVNNTRRHDADGTEAENRIHADIINDCIQRIQEAEQMAIDAGYVDVNEWWITKINTAYERLTESSGSVCASISLQIKQTMTMTRQAFRGTLTVLNGHETESMKDMKLNLVVSDKNNNVATSHEFQINLESLKDLDGNGELSLTNGWTLKPNTEGTATVLFIPTKYAAPTEPVEWSFGGTLTYVDPYSGLEVTRELYPVTLTVKPSPELDLTYFMQRDVYGDDPLTKDIIEPMENAEFALLINNKGNGDATNVKMVTQQPEIIENEKGLFINFEIVSSQVNGGPAALSFGQTIANDLGNIPAHSQLYAQWWLQSTLLGHFTSYNVEATHVTSYGNEDLSLLDQVTIHELIHGFTPPGTKAPARAFLVNDVEDADDMPDQLYFTDATQTDVYIAQSATATKQSGSEYHLTVVPSQKGWSYGSLLDPTAGKLKLLKVTRQSDNLEMPLDNFWQTSRSMRDGLEWLYENRLHFIGEMPATGETYILTYETRPDTELDFEFSKIVYDPEFAKEGLVTDDINEMTVTFNKPIKAETFTVEDVVYQVQGQKQDQTKLTITPKEGVANAYVIGLSNLNSTLPNGYYVLSIQGAGIEDNEGFNGLYGRKVDWVLFRGGLIKLNTKPFPANAGTINWAPVNALARQTEPASTQPSVQYGSQFRLTATPNEGYEFVNWTLNGEIVSTEAVYETNATSDMDFVANFKKKEYMIDVAAGENGSLAGSGAGYYEYESELSIVAKPDADFILKGWIVDGVAQQPTADNTLKLTVKKPMNIKAEFVRDIYTQTVTMARGWNWMSTYLNESQTLGDVAQYADRIVSQESELIKDPEYGLVGGIDALVPGKAYKIEASTRFSRTMRGHIYNTESSPVTLKKGWNWIAYPYYEVKPLSTLTNAEEGDFITAQTGFSSYAGGKWEGTLTELTPGTGYLYKSASNKQLTFNFATIAGSRAVNATTTQTQALNTPGIDIHRYPNTMNITAQVVRDGITMATGDYNIYAMVGNSLRGMSQPVGQNHYLTVYGDNPVDVTFVVELAETGETFVATETLKFRDDVVGSRKSPFTVTINGTTGINSIGNNRTMTVYTVEGVLVSRDATIKTLNRLPKGIYIVNGKKRIVK